MEGGREVVLVNLLNGRRLSVMTHVDPINEFYTYVEHADLLEWAKKTDCEKHVWEMWDGRTSGAFIGFEDDGIDTAVEILRNRNHRDSVSNSDDLACQARRVRPRKTTFEFPNRIPSKS